MDIVRHLMNAPPDEGITTDELTGVSGLTGGALNRALADLEMLGLALEGASLVACADVREGMRRLDEATAAALEDRAQVPISGAWTFCFLVSACMAVADLDRAAAWCERIERFQAALTLERSISGSDTAASTSSRIRSGLISSASAW